jgi:hypothetical protein
VHIFKNEEVPHEVLVDHIIKISKEFKLDPNEKKTRLLIMPELNQEIPWGFFVGASKGHPLRCGIGVVLFIIQNHFLHLRYAPGRGTNNRAEFITLWTLLEIAIKKGIKKL